MTDKRSHLWRGAFSRRTAIGGASAAVTGVLQSPLALAQDATPAPTTPVPSIEASSEKIYFLFVQTAQMGSFVPKPGEDGVYQVTLAGASAQTVYFSDRPERIVGTVPTVQFLDGLGFTPDSPPNAALVSQTEEGEEIVVVELLNPIYTEDFGPEGTVTLTYDVKILADYQEEGLAHLAERQGDAELPETFGHTNLFIDDCPDLTRCDKAPSKFNHDEHYEYIGPIPGGPFGMCWGWSSFKCRPCSERERNYYDQLCNDAYSECGNRCVVH